MKIEIVGVEPLFDENNQPKLGGKVYGVVLDDSSSRLIGNSTFSAYFGKVNCHDIKLGEIYDVDMELREFRGQYTAFPKGLIKA